MKKRATGNQEHQPEGTRDRLPRRAAGLRPALPDSRAVRAQVLHRRRPARRSSTSCTTSSTATTCSGTTRPSPRTATSSRSSRRSPAKFEGPKLERQVHRRCRGPARTARPSPTGTHVALTHWSVGGDPGDVSKQQGIWQYCAKPSGEAVEDLRRRTTPTRTPPSRRRM